MKRTHLLIPAGLALLALAACAKKEEPPPSEAAPAASMPAAAPAAAAPAKTATAKLAGLPGDADFSGTVTFAQMADGLHVTADLSGVDKDGKHGIHLHATGECDHDHGFKSAGAHFDPANTGLHACPPTDPRHAGDLGNVEIANGSGHFETVTSVLALDGSTGVVGKAVILHAGEDDCKTQPTGNSGDRYACGVIALDGMAPTDAPTPPSPN